MFRVSSPRRLDVAILSSSLLGALLIVALSNWNGDWFVENGPFEMLQVGALLGACLLFTRANERLNGWPGRLAVALALASLLFLVRELARCGSPYFVAGPCMPGNTKTYAYFLPLLLWAALVVRNPSNGPQAIRLKEFASLPRFVWQILPLVLVVVLLGIGQYADGRNMPALEEISELSAYLLLALAGLAATQEADRRALGQPTRNAVHVWAMR